MEEILDNLGLAPIGCFFLYPGAQVGKVPETAATLQRGWLALESFDFLLHFDFIAFHLLSAFAAVRFLLVLLLQSLKGKD